jgi:hypothetical protein
MKTKKMPVSLGKEGIPPSRSEFLIPSLGEGEDILIGIKSGKHHAQGAVSYIGMELSAEDILAKVTHLPCTKEEAIFKLRRFIELLQNFKIGNIISMRSGPDHAFELIKEAEKPKSVKLILP